MSSMKRICLSNLRIPMTHGERVFYGWPLSRPYPKRYFYYNSTIYCYLTSIFLKSYQLAYIASRSDAGRFSVTSIQFFLIFLKEIFLSDD